MKKKESEKAKSAGVGDTPTDFSGMNPLVAQLISSIWTKRDSDAVQARLDESLTWLAENHRRVAELADAREQDNRHSAEYWARIRAAHEVQRGFRHLFRTIISKLLDGIRFPRNADEKRSFICAFIIELAPAISEFYQLGRRPENMPIFAEIIGGKDSVPSVLGRYTTSNIDLQRWIFDGLGLGKMLPCHPDPKRTRSTYSLIAECIVESIDYERRTLWNRKKLSPRSYWGPSLYRSVVKDLDRMPFTREHQHAWSRVIGFHLDFYQAPPGRGRRAIEKMELDVESDRAMLLEKHEELEEEIRRKTWEDLDSEGRVVRRMSGSTAPSARTKICMIPEFQDLMKRDKAATSEVKLYNRVRARIEEAALAMMAPPPKVRRK